MLTPYSRLVIRVFSRGRSDARWFIRSLWMHAEQTRAGRDYAGRKVRNLRLAFGQHFLLRAINRPVSTILGPFAALCIYLYLVISLIAGPSH